MPGIEESLRENGHASLGTVLDADQCRALAGLYGSPERFRSRIVMQQYRFGRGEYQYFAYPLPPAVEHLRAVLYADLAAAASRWSGTEFPAALPDFLGQCRAAGQPRPTPLLLRYRAGDYNCLHQDLYGDVVFPFQVVVGLSRPGIDYQGGELLLVEQQPRAQSVGRVVPLAQGEAVAITTRYRPVQSTRGVYRAGIRHGVSPVHAGERYTLGIIFHDAK